MTRSPSRTEWASRVLRPSASSGACAPRWTCSDVMSAPACRDRRPCGGLQAGAYGMTASPTAFLGHPTPTELLV